MNKYDFQMKLFNLYCLGDIISMKVYSRKSAASQKRIQEKKLKKVINTAYNLPFYRERFDRAGVTPKDIKTKDDLKKLPILTKEEYREWMNKELMTEEAKHYKLTRTSGSTGIPTTNIYPPKEYAYHYMMDMFCWMQGGYNPFWGKTMTCSPGDAKVGQNSFIQKLGILRRKCFSMSWDRKKIIENINSYKPDFILGYSAELAYISQYAVDNGLQVHKPKFYCAGGQHVMGEQEKLLKKVLGPGMINYYGCTEMADFAYRKPGEDGYWTMQNNVVLSVLNDGEIKSEGYGSILATPLFRFRYPLINYAIGDNVVLTQREGKDYLEEICGREQDIFYWKSGKQTTHKDLWLISRTLDDIFQIRFIQNSYQEVLMQVVKDKKTKKTTEELEQYLVQKYADAFEQGITIHFEWFDEIPPDPNGKIRNMISNISK